MQKDFGMSVHKIVFDFCKDKGFRAATMNKLQNFETDSDKFEDEEMANKVLRYFESVVIPHKEYVYEEGMKLLQFFPQLKKTDYIYNLCIHDLSKFSAIESIGYANWDFKTKTGDKSAFDFAWFHHKKHNPHHPEYWIDVDRYGVSKNLEIPFHFIVEMVADWMGAGRAYGTPFDQWADANLPLFKFHERTAKALLEILQKIGYKDTYIFDGRIYFRD